MNVAADLQAPHHASPLSGEALVAAASGLADRFAEHAAKRDFARLLPGKEMELLKASGLLAARIPEAFGGAGASWRTTASILYELSRADPNIGQAIQAHNVIMEIVRADAPDRLRDRIFHQVVSGRMVTNAAAERDVAFYGDIATRLLPAPDGSYRLRGRKYYSTGSLFAEYLYITALSETDRPAAIIVPRDREGITIEDDWKGMGQRTTASGTVVLDDVAVHEDEVFFPPSAAERRWHLQAAAQLLHVAIDAGIARGGLADALQLAKTHGRTLRESGVGRAVDDPYVLQAIGDMSADVTASAAIMREAADRVDWAAGRYFDRTASEQDFVLASIAVAEAKIISTRAALKVGEKLFEVANASGTDQTLNLDRHWRNARTHTTHDPLSYKFRFIGDYLLNGKAPPSTVKI